MQKIKRKIQTDMVAGLCTARPKIHILYGARQVGKSTLAADIVAELGYKTLSINADEIFYRDILSSQSIRTLEGLVHGYEMLYIDEAQRVSDIGINLKILHDAYPDLKILVTGSSSFDLANGIREPLTGRISTYILYPISLCELADRYNSFELSAQYRDQMMVYGAYPDILLEKNMLQKRKLLTELATSYIYKDILLLEHIRYPEKLHKLLKLLAYQIGQQVSIHELSQKLEINRDTVIRYIYLLEQTFIIYRIGGYSTNLRTEVTKMDKIYFHDLGIRNILVEDTKSLDDRNDVGHLWENFIINERRKMCAYSQKYRSTYFWRNHAQAEIDYIEEYDGGLHAYEIKYGTKVPKIPKAFATAYPAATYTVIDRENFLDYVV